MITVESESFFPLNSYALSVKDCLGLFFSGDISGPGIKVENNPQSFSMSPFFLLVGHF